MQQDYPFLHKVVLLVVIFSAVAIHLGFIYCLINIVAYISGGNKLTFELRSISIAVTALMLLATILLFGSYWGHIVFNVKKNNIFVYILYCLSFFIIALLLGSMAKMVWAIDNNQEILIWYKYVQQMLPFCFIALITNIIVIIKF